MSNTVDSTLYRYLCRQVACFKVDRSELIARWFALRAEYSNVIDFSRNLGRTAYSVMHLCFPLVMTGGNCSLCPEIIRSKIYLRRPRNPFLYPNAVSAMIRGAACASPEGSG